MGAGMDYGLQHLAKAEKKGAETNWKEGRLHGASIEYHGNGRKRSEIYYTDNTKNGLEKRWDESGRVTIEGYYHLGNKIGVWVEWPRGAKSYWKKETRYFDDKSKPSVEITWDVEGKKLSETHVLNGKKTLQIFAWYENGHPKSTTETSDGKETFTVWYENGTKSMESVSTGNGDDQKEHTISWDESGKKTTERTQTWSMV